MISSKYAVCSKNIVKHIITQITQKSVWERRKAERMGAGREEKEYGEEEEVNVKNILYENAEQDEEVNCPILRQLQK